MKLIRPATRQDEPVILRILKELDLYYQSQRIEDFFLLEEAGQVVGLAQLKEFPKYYFLSSLGIIPSHQHRGLAAFILQELFLIAKKDIYIYTVIPEFFERFGFQSIPQTSGLPSKKSYECADCYPDKCVTMVRLCRDT
ncbi:hypothetical protein A2311_04450 [candidate division WOR-1 bacterium RIFOXYB2_FULL_48_7]|uniref:N-acetyltransferase domain-containing protein n=1 Tax=candidate division WOR-1 bacterium RIFOXYB2_FULL_48_7 TaxID=1802583 RepID=A0A1F4TIQ7_UNCSA|nr:MAG: hypothetical protein A2311_04450 [candidate division WOR-1 bacterium RIFOXYB2_FULL_48_7]